MNQMFNSAPFNENKTPTCVWSATVVWPRRRSSISGLYLQCECPLLLPVKHQLGEHLAGLRVDLERVLPLVPDAVHDVVVHLVIREGPILVDGIDPEITIVYDYAQNYLKSIFALFWQVYSRNTNTRFSYLVTGVPMGSPSITVSCSLSVNRGISSLTSSNTMKIVASLASCWAPLFWKDCIKISAPYFS